MSIVFGNKSSETLLVAALAIGGLSGCVEEKSLNNEAVEYAPEQRPLGVIAGEGAEYEPGSPVSLSGRLIGTTTGQTVLWSQKSGTPIEGIEDWTQATLSFTAPLVVGIEAFVFEITALESDGSVAVDEDGNPLVAETTVTIFDPATKLFYEVEDTTVAELKGVELATSGSDQYISGASGDTHTADMTPGASIEYTINVEQEEFVTLYASFASPYSEKGAKVTVNGLEFELMIPTTAGFNEYRMGVIKLNAGDNIIEVGGGWDYYRVDYIMTVPAAQPAGPLAVLPNLVNDNASQEAKDLMGFLTEHYGTSTLTGQTEFPRKSGDTFPLTEFDKIVNATGDNAPAVVAFDFMNYSSSHTGTDFDGLTESMIAAHNDKNIIVSALHHWRAPSANHNAEGAFYTNATDFDLAAALADTNSAEYAELIADIDIIAAELQKLEDAGVPVLWRPLHEAEGGWFWWGAAGSTALKELWVIMYDRMTTHHGLDNLIWVFTHTSSLSEDWYPGDAYVDIVGYDGYASPANDATASFSSQYATLKNRHNGDKLVALTETGTIPSVSTMHEQNAWWSFFITWNSETWDSSSLIGPDGTDAGTIDTNYAADGVINLDDIPGGRDKIEVGTYEGFDISVSGFEGQINWSPQPGISVTNGWAASGAHALTYKKDLSAEAGANGVILQTYPTDGIDVTDVATLKVSANALNAGTGITVKLWAKDGVGAWRDAGAVALEANGLELSIDVSDIDTVSGFGLQIENFDATSTAGEFYLDNVRLDDTVLYDFEPDTSGFEGQINWGPQPGITVTNDWATHGVRALTYIKDLSAEDGANGVILQTYPSGGIDVTGVSLLKLSTQAINTGDATTVKLWAKDGDGAWRDAGATALVAAGLELEIDVSDIDTVSGFGLQIENFDATATDAKFYMDNVRLDDAVLYDFEGTGKWEFQVNWSPADGVQLAKDWSLDGDTSLSGVTQLVDGDDNVILQVYPTGGVLLGDVSTLKVTANVKDAGAGVQVQLFAKDKEFAWRDGGAIDMIDGGVELSLDVSDLTEISGFGVRFMNPDNSATPAKFYIDKVEFE
jgi:mannan endo-1,4-beta-mannosidase